MKQPIMQGPVTQQYGIKSIATGLAERFLQQVTRQPAHVAIITARRALTYGQLAEQAKRLAAHLLRLGIQKEEPVAIILGPGVEQIVCQVAILLAGGTCVPFNPSLPDERLDFMLAEIQARFTLTDTSSAQRSLATRFIQLDDYPRAEVDLIRFPDTGPEHRSHILFTSGTTGRPKGVELEAHGIMHLLVNNRYLQLDAADRIACIANPSFDASLLEVWGALLNGATLVLIAKETLLDPPQLTTLLREEAITFMLMTTSLFNFMAPQCPRAFRALNYLLVGGETFNPQMLKMIPADDWPRHLVNAYGPTEGTVITACHHMSAADVSADNVPIGKELDKAEVYILDEHLQPVADGTVGEIHIGGNGLARGYVNRPELTQQKFLFTVFDGEQYPKRLYASGDLGWRRPDGAIMYAGRIDNQIKLQGYRIEAEEIELQLLKSGLLLAAVVCVIKKPGTESYLVAYVVPIHPKGFAKNHLLDWLKQQLPAYMLPRLQIVAAIPLNDNGKADRAALMALPDTPQAAIMPVNAANNGEAELLALWRQILDIQSATLDDEFYLLGGTSLQAARLVLEIKRRFGQRLAIQDLYDAQTPRNLLRRLRQPQEQTDDICAVLLQDSQLPAEITALPDAPAAWTAPQAGRVLLTGATGYMGAFVLRDLLLQPAVRQVICLVRARDHATAMARVQQNLTRYGLWRDDFSRHLQAFASELGQPLLGLEPETYQQLAGQCDVIIHIASHISFIEPYLNHREANVTGVLNILRLAVAAKPKPLHYVSTVAVAGPAGLLFPVKDFFEEDDLMPYLSGMQYTLGYIQSKWVAERLLWQARERVIPLAVYRPGFILADSVTGAGNPDDFMGRLIKGCIKTGAYPLLPGDRKEFVTVDYVSAALINIAMDNQRLGHIYHLIPPDHKQSISLNAFFALFGSCGYSMIPLPYPQWVQRLYDDPEIDANPLMPLLPMLSQVVYEQLTIWEVFKDIPRYDASQTQVALSGKPTPVFIPTDAALLTRYLDHMKSIGFL